jgi:hypothetical protein
VTAPGSAADSLRQALTSCYWPRLGPSPANRQYLTAPKRGQSSGRVPKVGRRLVSFAPRRSELFLHCHRRSIVELVWRHRSIRDLLGVSKRIVSEKPSFIIPDDSGQLTQPFQRSNGGSALHTAMGPAIFIPPPLSASAPSLTASLDSWKYPHPWFLLLVAQHCSRGQGDRVTKQCLFLLERGTSWIHGTPYLCCFLRNFPLDFPC